MNSFLANATAEQENEKNDVLEDEDQMQSLTEDEDDDDEEEEEVEDDDLDDNNNLSESMLMAASINPLSLLNSSLETAPSSLVDPISNESVEDDEEEEDDDGEGEENDVLDVSRGDDEEEQDMDVTLISSPLMHGSDNDTTIDVELSASARASFSTTGTNEQSINIMTSALMTSVGNNTIDDDDDEEEEEDEEEDEELEEDEDDDEDADEVSENVLPIVHTSPMQTQDSGMTDRESLVPEGTHYTLSSTYTFSLIIYFYPFTFSTRSLTYPFTFSLLTHVRYTLLDPYFLDLYFLELYFWSIEEIIHGHNQPFPIKEEIAGSESQDITDTPNKSGFRLQKNVVASRIVDALAQSSNGDNSDEIDDQSTVNIGTTSTSIPVKNDTARGIVNDGDDVISPSAASCESGVERHVPLASSLSSPSSTALPASVSASRHDDGIASSLPQNVVVTGEVGQSLLDKEEVVQSTSIPSTHPLSPTPHPLDQVIQASTTATTGSVVSAISAMTPTNDASTTHIDASPHDNVVDVTSASKAASNSNNNNNNKATHNTTVNNSNTTNSNNNTTLSAAPSKTDVKTSTESDHVKATPSQKATATTATTVTSPVQSDQQLPSQQQLPPKTSSSSKNKTIAGTNTPSHLAGGGVSTGASKATGGSESGSSSTQPSLTTTAPSIVYPIDAHRDDILRQIQRDRVTIISGNLPYSQPHPTLPHSNPNLHSMVHSEKSCHDYFR